MRLVIPIMLATLLIFQNIAFAQIFSSQAGFSGGAEYWVGKGEGKPMITVDLWGGVRSAGVYHIPIDTSLTKLIAYAGGVVQDAKLDEVGVRRQKGKDEYVYMEMDIERLSKQNAQIPILSDKDVITIPISRSWKDTTQILAVTGSILAIILSARAVANN